MGLAAITLSFSSLAKLLFLSPDGTRLLSLSSWTTVAPKKTEGLQAHCRLHGEFFLSHFMAAPTRRVHFFSLGRDGLCHPTQESNSQLV